MRTEANKSFRFGFALTEQELRRLFDSMSQQLKRVTGGEHPISYFEVKFRNGAIAEPSSLDEVFTVENVGSTRVTRLGFSLQDRPEKPSYSVSVGFANPHEDDDYFTPIRYSVIGDERDWVFVTSSELEERIRRVHVHSPDVNKYQTFSSALLIAAFLLPFMVVAAVMIPEATHNAGATVEAAWKSGSIKDPIEAMILLENERMRKRPVVFRKVFGLPILAGLCGSFAFWGAWNLAVFLFPPFNFCWGEYTKVYQRRADARRYIFIVLLTGLLVSLLGSMLANRFR